MHYLIYQLSQMRPPLLRPAELDATEQAAYARRGERYLLIRSVLKHELSKRTGAPAASIRFTYTEQGKPEYAEQPFNISHSGDILCLALHHGPIGVDVEKVYRREHMPRLAERIMCPEQLSRWQQRHCPVGEFFACWCAAEALAKQCAGSIWQARQRPFLWHTHGIEPLYPDAPTVELFEPAPGYCGAVAYHP